MPQIVAPCCGDHRGAFVFAVGLAVGELSRSACVSPESKQEVKDDMWGHPVSDSAFKMEFFPFSEMNK